MGNGRGGRKSRLNERTAENIIAVLRAGNYIATACEYAGINPATFHLWMNRGESELDNAISKGVEEPEEIVNDETTGKTLTELFNGSVPAPEGFDPKEWPYVLFRAQVIKAQAASEIRVLAHIQSAAETQWQAGAWFLERTRPEKYGRRDRINVEGPKNGGPLEVVTAAALEDSLNKLLGDNGS